MLICCVVGTYGRALQTVTLLGGGKVIELKYKRTYKEQRTTFRKARFPTIICKNNCQIFLRFFSVKEHHEYVAQKFWWGQVEESYSFQWSLRTFWLVNSFSPGQEPARRARSQKVLHEVVTLWRVMAAATVVKKDGIRKRSFPQSSTKHMLSSPYHLQW